MPRVDFANYKLLHLFIINGLRILQGSDHHIPLYLANEYITALIHQIRQQPPDILILNGDLFDARYGEATQRAVGRLLCAVSRNYKGPIVYVPGNHCLRSHNLGKQVWTNFGDLPDKNFYAPLTEPLKPIVLPTRAGNMLIGNIFYDFKFIDPLVIGKTEQDIRDFYAGLPDGQFLLGGHTKDFSLMADTMAAALTPDIKFLVTHCLPHPILAELKLVADTILSRHLQEEFGVSVDHGLAEKNHHLDMSLEDFINYWDSKAIVMGSNILQRPGFGLAPDGLTVFYGHNHRSIYEGTKRIGDKRIDFRSHQNVFNSQLPNG